MSKIHTILMAGVALAIAAPLPGQEAPAKKTVQEWIATLQSNATREEKADACRELSVRGTKEAVPVLASLLPDKDLNHMARYALEPIPAPAVDEAFRAALGTLKGRPLVGVICSIGVRRDAKAVPMLAKLLGDADTEVAQAAARSLGRVGTAPAATALQAALPGAKPGNHIAVCEGLFRCAAALKAQGRRDDAVAIYDRLRALPGPQQVRSGALSAAILIRQKDGLPLLVEQLGSPDYILFAAAIRAAQQLPCPEVTPLLCTALDKLPADRQIPVILALGNRRDPAALPAIAALAKASVKPVRLTAIRTLAELGQIAALPVLLDSLGDADRELAQAALESVAAQPGREVDAAVMAMFAGSDTARRLAALELIGRRRMTSATPALLKAAGDSDAQIRAAAMRRLGELAGPAELPVLCDMLMRGKTPQDLGEVEAAIIDVVGRQERPESYAGKFSALLAKASPDPKSAVLRILSAAGGPDALKAVRTVVDDPSEEMQAAAIRALGAWKTRDVVPELLAVARGDAHPGHKMLALRAYLGWAGRADLSADERLAICRQAAQFVKRIDEKRLLLSALGNVDSPEALGLIVPYLSEADTKDEAAAAAVSAAERLLKRPDAASFAARMVDPLQKVAKAPVAPHLAQRAKASLQQAQRKPRKK